jgi:hypothetical protein
MSTKFRQSFVRLCNGCRPTSKGQHSSAVLFYKEYAKRPILMSVNRGGIAGTISTTDKLSYYQSNIHQLQEKKFLLIDNTPTPVTAGAIDTTKFIFPA